MHRRGRKFGTLVEDKMRMFNGKCAQFSFIKCPIDTHDGASAKFSTNSQEKVNSMYTVTLYVMIDRVPGGPVGVMGEGGGGVKSMEGPIKIIFLRSESE